MSSCHFRFLRLCVLLQIVCFGLIACGSGSGGKSSSNNPNPTTPSSAARSSTALSSQRSSVTVISSSSRSSVAISSQAAASSVAAGAVISTSGGNSHNAGQDCMSCHKAGGSGAAKGIFTVAGTVYRNSAAGTGSTVILYRVRSNIINVSLPTDQNGNFYTNQPVADLFVAGGPLVNGVDPVVMGPSGGTNSMPGIVTNGSCNACHSPSGGVAKIQGPN